MQMRSNERGRRPHIDEGYSDVSGRGMSESGEPSNQVTLAFATEQGHPIMILGEEEQRTACDLPKLQSGRVAFRLYSAGTLAPPP